MQVPEAISWRGHASTTPPPRVGELRDDAPSPHPHEALLRDEQPTVNQQQKLEDYLKQVLASAGWVSQEHFPEVVSMIKNMDQLFRDMRVKMQPSKEVWRRNARTVSPGDIFARILQQEDRRRVPGWQVSATPPALSSPATPAEFDEDAFIRSCVTEFLAESNLLAPSNPCFSGSGRGGGLSRCSATKKLYLEVGLFVANAITCRSTSRDVFGK